MKITKKILISSLAITPLTTLAFVPSVVRPKEVKTHGNNYTKDIITRDIVLPKDLVNIIKELFKEFDIDISVWDSNLLATKIEEKRNELNEKIRISKNIIKELEKRKVNPNYLDTNEFELRKFCIDNLNYKLKLLEEIENNLLSKIMRKDYIRSMEKYYSIEALAYTIAKILRETNRLEDLIKLYKDTNSKDVEARKEMTRHLSISIGSQMEILNRLNAHREILEKHFPINKDMIKQYYEWMLKKY